PTTCPRFPACASTARTAATFGRATQRTMATPGRWRYDHQYLRPVHSVGRSVFRFDGQPQVVGVVDLVAGTGGDRDLDRAGGGGRIADGLDGGDLGRVGAGAVGGAASRLGEPAELPPGAGCAPAAAPA